ncbi:MAG: DNA translocase FtsK, partial [Abitibacteriaceae bacterium]|nr:DNA translocase FtsK [Abditibacteriaceae bacterium]
LLIVRRHHTNLRAFGRGVLVGCLVLLTAVHLTVPKHQEFLSADVLFSHGGYVGAAIAWALRRALGEVGAIIALVAFSIVALLFFTEVSLGRLASGLGNILHHNARKVPKSLDAMLQREEEEPEDFGYLPPAETRPTNRRKVRSLPPEIIRESQQNGSLCEDFERNGVWQGNAWAGDNPAVMGEPARRSPFMALDNVLKEELEVEPTAAIPFNKSKQATPESNSNPQSEAPRIEIVDTPPPPSVVGPTMPPVPSLAATPPPEENQTSVPINAPDDELTPVEALEAQALATASKGASPKKQRPQQARRSFGDGPPMPEYFDPAVRALDPPLAPDVVGVEDDIQRGVQSVQETLASFKIDARVTDVKRGPVITRYEVQPAPGVRVAAIANLDRDIARALSAIAVRIEAPVPGKNVVGIEVPNKRVHLVRLRDVLELPEFLAGPSKLSFVLGKDIAGQPKWADLTKMPHLLIAGATNSGKSVCLNSIITSILVRATPEEVKFSLIDPKRVELTLYRDIKHLYHPVVVEPKDAVKALRGAIVEMDRRYKRFAERGVRNIASYNAKLQEDEAPLPYIVIVIDELADLMMTAAAEFEKLICRLAQLARATGIHLIVATQRPSVNVITGVIKANIPARIAFAVASQVDSRTILDAVGAERLIGSGDMLFDSNNGGKSTRIQGAYLSEEEVNRIVEVVKNHYADDDEPIEYGLDLNEMDDGPGGDDDDDSIAEEKRDDLYESIREFVLRNNEMSASMIQRKFEIGYPRAGRIVDQLERDGILSPPDGSKARKVISTGR